MKRIVLTAVLVLIAVMGALSSCGVDNPIIPPPGENSNVTEVVFTGQTETIYFNNLHNNNIVLAKINTSSGEIDMTQTGGAYLPYASIPWNESEFPNLLEDFLIIGHPAATAFQANPPPLPEIPEVASRSPTVLSISNTIGDIYNFWVETVLNSGDFIQKEAVLQAIGEYCKIWVIPNTNPNQTITQLQAQTLAQKFDIIYPAATNLLGNEYGGGPEGNGGKDGDPKIQILVYDIGGNTGGYFNAEDYLNNFYSNQTEIFYLNAEYVNNNPEFIYSALIHELQHMINWNEKTIKNNIYSSPWYNEMLSMMAEDVMSSLIGINPYNPQRIPMFLGYYFLMGITEWKNNGDYIHLSYAYNYVYGAYLLQNFGGAELLKELLSNNYVNEISITTALNKLYGYSYNFQYTLKRFCEALVYTSSLQSNAMSFDKTVYDTINGVTYTAYGFNVWNMYNYNINDDYFLSYYFNDKGPTIISNNYWINMPPYSIALFSEPKWLNRSGSLSITLERPLNPNIKFILMVF